MKAARVEVWVWVLIYAGLAVFGLGMAVQSRDASIGWTLVALGIASFVAGALLIWVRSRMSSDPPIKKHTP